MNMTFHDTGVPFDLVLSLLLDSAAPVKGYSRLLQSRSPVEDLVELVPVQEGNVRKQEW